MKPSAASLVFAALVAASLSGKLLANRMEPAPDAALFDASVAGLLREGGFAVALESHGFAILERGRRPGCTILAGDYDPHGTFDETFRQLAAPVGPLRFAWRGRSFDAAPKLRPLLDFYVRRELRRIGMAPGRTPIVAYAASPGCDAGDLAWERVAYLPR
jgi:hypothetical protein